MTHEPKLVEEIAKALEHRWMDSIHGHDTGMTWQMLSEHYPGAVENRRSDAIAALDALYDAGYWVAPTIPTEQMVFAAVNKATFGAKFVAARDAYLAEHKDKP